MPRHRAASRNQLAFACVLLGFSPLTPASEPNVPTTSEAPPAPLLLQEFRPKSMLRNKPSLLRRARYPVVDVHTHFHFKLRGGASELPRYVEMMDRNRIALSVSLDGPLGEAWKDHEELLWTKYRDRFLIFGFIDWRGTATVAKPEAWACNQPGFARRIVSELEEAKSRGASGVKIFKTFGLEVPNPDGSLARIDDPRWDAIWQACGELGLPVLIHVADPRAFFEPVDATNERWEELVRHPDWSFADPRFPRHAELLDAFLRVVARHPKTEFLAAHVANNAEDLAEVGRCLDAYPNLNVEIASRIAELGRQPYTARKFFERYADRILFGTDGPWPEERLGLYWRFLETADEYFPYSEKPFPPQGFWNIYGLDLPDKVLRKVYHENAERLIPGVREKLARWRDAD